MPSALLPALALVAVAPDAPMAARADDAAVDQSWLTPTALTQPARTITVEAHDLLLILTVTYAPIDRVQVTLRGAPPLGASKPSWVAATAKARLLDAERLHLSGLAGTGLVSGVASRYEDEGFLAVGAVGSFCFNLPCRGLASLYVLAHLTRETDSHDVHNDFFRVFYGANLLVPLATHVKLVTEVNIIGEHRGANNARTTATTVLSGVAGVRFHSGRFAGLVGALVLSSLEQQTVIESQDEWILLPAVSFGGRIGGGP